MNDISTSNQEIGRLKKEICDVLSTLLEADINLEGKSVLIGNSNLNHVKERHPEIFEKYTGSLSDIISMPDYVGVHPDGKSIELIKKFEDNILVAIRIKNSGPLWIKSFYEIKDTKLSSYVSSGRTIELFTARK